MLFLTALTMALATAGEAFVHPGLLQSSADFDRIKKNIAAGNQPWLAGYQMLLDSGFATPTYQPNPAPTIYRGSDGVHSENYGQLYIDVGAAYILSLLWAITGESQWGNAAISVLDAWSSVERGDFPDKHLTNKVEELYPAIFRVINLATFPTVYFVQKSPFAAPPLRQCLGKASVQEVGEV
jgi:hypothetical protein